MKMIAYALNIILIGIAIFAVVDDWGHINIEQMLIYIPVLACPIVNIIVLSLSYNVGWFGLFFQRKALEEKKKIEKLHEEIKKETK